MAIKGVQNKNIYIQIEKSNRIHKKIDIWPTNQAAYIYALDSKVCADIGSIYVTWKVNQFIMAFRYSKLLHSNCYYLNIFM